MDVVSSSYDATARVPAPAEAPRAAPMALRSSRAYGTYAPQARRPRTALLPDVLLEELDRALARLIRARLVERAALVARKAVARGIDVLREVRVVLLHLLPVFLGDRRVGLTPLEDDRTLRLLGRRVGDAAAVERDRRGHAVDAGRGQPGHGAAETVAHHADLEARLLRFLHRSAHVLDGVVDRQLAAHGAAALDVGLLVAGLEAALDAVEEGGRDGEVPVLREAVGDVLDVMVHAEDLLDHDQGAAGRAARRGFIGGELVSVFGGQGDHLTHGIASFVARVIMPHARARVHQGRADRPHRQRAWARDRVALCGGGLLEPSFASKPQLPEVQLDNTNQVAEMRHETQRQIAGREAARPRQKPTDKA